MAITMLDIGISIGVVVGFGLIIWSKIVHKSITEVIIDIKELFGVIKGE